VYAIFLTWVFVVKKHRHCLAGIVIATHLNICEHRKHTYAKDFIQDYVMVFIEIVWLGE
jgi:hypothetical protein